MGWNHVVESPLHTIPCKLSMNRSSPWRQHLTPSRCLSQNLPMKSTLPILFSLTFSLSIHAQNLPYTTGFDNTSEQAGWTYYQEGDAGSSQWGMTGGGSSAPNSLHHDYNVGAPNDAEVIDWMVSPALNFTGPVAISMLVSESGFSTPTDDNCLVYIGTGNQDPTVGDFTLIGNLSFISPQWTWVDTTFYSSITGNECYLAFRYKTIGAAWCTYGIDDIVIDLQNPNGVAEETHIQPHVIITPNPVHDLLNISTVGDGIGQIDIMSTTGQCIRTIQWNIGSMNTIDMTEFPVGVYFLRWKDVLGIEQTWRFIKQ